MPDNTRNTQKILSSVKGLQAHLQEGEEPLLNIPAIWDGAARTADNQPQRSMPCDVILTNQRLFGYVYVTFPRERLFLEALPLANITNVTLRQKSFEPIFHELQVSDGQRKVYIRAPKKKIESLYTSLRAAIEQHTPASHPAFLDEQPDASTSPARPAPVYGRQEIRVPFESSPLAITMLFVGGILLEIGGALIWSVTQSASTGLPLCVAGFVCVMTAIFMKMRRR